LIPLKDNIPTLRFPILTVLLIVANIAVFAWQSTLSSTPGSSRSPHVAGLSEQDEATLDYGAIPYRLTHPGRECAVGATGTQTAGVDVVCQGTREYAQAQQLAAGGLAPFEPLDSPPWWATVVTSMFMHGGILHIAFNMLFLWIFGNNVEDSMGRPRFLLFYLLAGAAAAYGQSLLDPDSTIPLIGASGAIAGVLGGYLLLHPHARVLTMVIVIFFVTLIEVPALAFLVLWFALQFVGQFGASDVAGGGGVAYFAHVGGFVFGLATIKLFASRRRAMGPGPPGPAY
jgi:membrane associated rhomboid family serine protease